MYRKVKRVHSDKGGHVADAQRLQVAVERRNRFRASAEQAAQWSSVLRTSIPI